MGGRFTDGCDYYGAAADLLIKYVRADSPWTWSSSSGRLGGGCLSAATTGAGILRTFTGLTTSTSGSAVGFWFKLTGGAPAAEATIWNAYSNNGGALIARLTIPTSGAITIKPSSLSALATGPVVSDGNWHWVELRCGSGSSTWNWYVDGAQVYTATVSSGSNGFYLDQFEFVSVTNRTLLIDDPIMYDGMSAEVPTLSSFPLGMRQITTEPPVADTATKSFAASTGSSNYAMIDDVAPDGDATYVQGASGDFDLYDFTNLGFAPSSINFVGLNTVAENPGLGVITFKGVCKSSATETDGTAVTATPNYRAMQEFFNVDPNTAAVWTVSGLDAATFGTKVV